MPLETPHADHAGLSPMASRHVDVETLPWQETPFPGVRIKILMRDPDGGLMTSLTRLEPGATLPDHTHEGIEQSYVLEGALEDDEGRVTAGNFVWRPAGSRHTARAPEGCLVLGFFQKPNTFHGQG